MKTCKKCKNEFEETKGLTNYCSLRCRNSRKFTDESNKKRSDTMKNLWRFLSIEERDKKIVRASKFHTFQSLQKLRHTYHQKLLAKGFENCGKDAKRKLVLIEQDNKCNRCGNDSWLGEKLTLEIDHKDGNRENDSRENLEAICPNCHSLTPTWRGRNRPSANGINIVSDEELKLILATSKNVRQALLAAGMAAKGNNYKRAKRLLEELNV